MGAGSTVPGMEFARWMFVFCGAGFWAAIGYKVLNLGAPWVLLTAVLLGFALMGISAVINPFGQASQRSP